MTEDWVAVATAINQRMIKLRVSQYSLIKRSGLSKQIVYELQHNSTQRRRSPRTLEALSVALEWHPHHLAAVLEHRTPPEVGDPVVTFVMPNYDVPGRLATLESLLREISDRLNRIEASTTKLDQLSTVYRGCNSCAQNPTPPAQAPPGIGNGDDPATHEDDGTAVTDQTEVTIPGDVRSSLVVGRR
jgi:hypothetical protein